MVERDQILAEELREVSRHGSPNAREGRGSLEQRQASVSVNATVGLCWDGRRRFALQRGRAPNPSSIPAIPAAAIAAMTRYGFASAPGPMLQPHRGALADDPQPAGPVVLAPAEVHSGELVGDESLVGVDVWREQERQVSTVGAWPAMKCWHRSLTPVPLSSAISERVPAWSQTLRWT